MAAAMTLLAVTDGSSNDTFSNNRRQQQWHLRYLLVVQDSSKDGYIPAERFIA